MTNDRRQFWENKEWFGEPCSTYDPECVNCIHWEIIAYIRTLEKENEALRKGLKTGIHRMSGKANGRMGKLRPLTLADCYEMEQEILNSLSPSPPKEPL